MTGYHFRPASRSEAKPLIGIYSESGCGKTYSSLVLARGFVGPKGKIGMIETESGRGEAYASPEEYPEIGGYSVSSLRQDFSPTSYGKAIDAAEAAKLDALIIDSASHEWEGTGGVLAMAADNQEKGKKGVLVWQQPKMDHQRKFMLRFMQSPIPLVILNMRAKYPMMEVPKQGGGKDWVRSQVLEPKQSDDILFEMFVHGWVDAAHAFHMTKCTAKSLEPVFGGNKPLSVETGQQLAAWAAGAPARAQDTPRNEESAKLLKEAREVATLGKERLQEYWRGLPKAGREVVHQIMDELKQTAIEADKEAEQSAGGGEDPFPGDIPFDSEGQAAE